MAWSRLLASWSIALVASACGSHAASAASGPGAVSPSRSSLVSAPAEVVADGAAAAILTATALDDLGAPVPGKTAVFGVGGSANQLSAPSAVTGAAGVATVTLASTRAEAKAVSVVIDGVAVLQHAGVTFIPGAAAALVVSGPSGPQAAGAAFTVTVTARDAFGNLATGYAGTVHLTSSDGAAILGADSTLTGGVGTFGVTLRTAGAQTVAATDTASAAVTGVSGPITVTAASLPVPTLAQHVSSSYNPVGQGIDGNGFRFFLPNAVGAGNVLVLGISYDVTSPARTVAVSDDNGNAWPGTPAVSTSNGNLTSSIFVLPNANPGVTRITVTFSGVVHPFQYTISEFHGVATSAPVNGSHGSSASAVPGLSAGAFTPGDNDAGGGNLVWTYAVNNVNASGNFLTTWAAGAGHHLLDADQAWHAQGMDHASEFSIQATSAPIDPGFAVTATGGADTFNVVSVALRAAAAGTAPPAGIRIMRIAHLTSETPPATWQLQFPSQGNLIVAVTNEQSPVIDVTGVTDDHGNGWLKVEPDPTEPQLWYAENATPAEDLRITLSISGRAAGSTVVLYDIRGARASGALDGSGGTPSATDTGGLNLTGVPIFTPSSPGLTIVSVGFGQGPCSGLAAGAPAGAVFDLVYYDNEFDTDTMDNADAKAHVYDTGNTPQSWSWVLANRGLTTSYASVVAHFAAGP
jgi:hypothetical protein